MKNFVKTGNTLTFIAVAAVVSGAGLLLGDAGLFGVSTTTVAIGESGEADIEGVFELPKAAVAVDAFDAAYWDDTAKTVTNVATDNTKIGVFTETYASGDGTANVKLLPAV